jgi:geranylgeranyl diphosphate synthase type I
MTRSQGEPLAHELPHAGDPATALAGHDEVVAEVERFMQELSTGGQPDVLGAIGVSHLATGGKRLRARLALAALEALGGRARDGLAWAAACELLHNASLVHDDLQDGDRFRRGSPTVWSRFGAAEAINLGDLFISLALRAVGFSPVDAAVRYELLQTMSAAMEACVRGQSAELRLREHCTRPDALERYLASARGKTGTLFQLPLAGAALLAGRSPAQARLLGEEFLRLGVLFQLQDDILDLYGAKGREVTGADLAEGKVSCLVIAHLRLHPDEAGWLLELLAQPRDSTDLAGITRAIRRFAEGGALAESLRLVEEVAGALERSPLLQREPALHRHTLLLVQQMLAPIHGVMHAPR